MALSRNDPRTVAAFVEEATNALTDGLTEANTLGEAAVMVRNHIVARTKAGRDRRGRRFASYKESTKRKKRKKRQRIRPPSLTDTEQMLNDLTVQGVDGFWGDKLIVADIGFATRRSESIARFHITETRHMAERDFVGLDDEAADRINQFIGLSAQRKLFRDRRRRIKLVIFKQLGA